MPALDQVADRAQADGVIGHVDVGQRIVGRLLPEEVPLEHAARIREPPEPLGVEDGAIDVADDQPVHPAALDADEVGDLLGLIGVPARMDIDGGAGLPLGEDGAQHDPLFLGGPGSLAADLADDTRAHVRAPGAVLHRLDHLLGEVLDAARGIGRILVGVYVVAAAHDDVGAGGAGNLDEAEGIGTEPTR